MSKRLDDNIGAVEYDGLITSNVPIADVFSVNIRMGNAATTLKRGTVLALSASGSTADGKMVILGTAAHETSGTADEVLLANCILAEDVVVGTTADATALAYRTGHFARNKLIVKDSYTMTAADEDELRKGGILLSDAVEY